MKILKGIRMEIVLSPEQLVVFLEINLKVKGENLMNKKLKSLLVFGAICVFGSTMVYAGTSYVGYSTTVGRFNGSGYTSYQTKSISGANGGLSSGSVGADYVVDARMQEYDGPAGAWTRDVDDNTYYDLDGHVEHKSGDSVRVQFSNDWNTPVQVQVSGSWKSN